MDYCQLEFIFSVAIYTLSALALFSVLLFYRISRGISYTGGIPRVGPPGVFGYISTALRFTFDVEMVIMKGRREFSGRPFAIPTLAGPVFLLPPEYLDIVRSSNDDVFNEPTAVNEDLQLPFTMDVHQMETPYQATVLRTDVNRAIPAMIPYILEESDVAIAEVFKTSSQTNFITIPVFDTMTRLIARISNRVIFGTELCRNHIFLHAIVRFSETVTLIAPFIRWSPSFAQGFVYFLLSSIFGGKKEPLRHIIPFLQHLSANDDKHAEYDEPLIARFLIRASLPNESLEGIATRLLNINFGSIHTSSIFITQTLFQLALLSDSDLDSIREEILAALASEGGWTKGALLKFRKLDSALREVGRFYGLMHFALPRVAVRGYDLRDGTRVPSGHRVAIDMKAVHYNAEVYPNPDQCDLFRFSTLKEREEGGGYSKYGFATPDNNYLPFGAGQYGSYYWLNLAPDDHAWFSLGRHACAGRFFAAMELKIMLAHILLKFDISLPDGITERPTNFVFNGAIIPDSKAQLVFTHRAANHNLAHTLSMLQ